jgi:hypothetical protein
MRAALRELASRALNLSETTRRLRAAVDALEQQLVASRDEVPGEVGPPSVSTYDQVQAEASSEPSRDEAPTEVGAPSGSRTELPLAQEPSTYPRRPRVITYESSDPNNIIVVHIPSPGGS